MSGPWLQSRPARVVRAFLLSFAAWALLAGVLVGHFAVAVGLPWPEAVRVAIRDWAPWALVTPGIFSLVAWLPLERGRWRAAIPAHLACAAGVLLVVDWWGSSVMPHHPQGGARPTRLPSGEMRRGGPRRGGLLGPFGLRLPMYLAVLSAAHAMYFARRGRERERRELELSASLALARLEALHMQLQPHFLFNALNSIAALVHSRPDAADEMLAALSDLLRLTLQTSGEQELPLRRERELAERYLAIEQVRFGDRLRCEVDLPADTLDALVPTFLLQPLVENAVRHGLEPRGEPGLLRISARREGAILRICVGDNGGGLPEGAAMREGIGLANTRARLLELYGTQGLLELRSQGGLQVTVRIPYHTAA